MTSNDQYCPKCGRHMEVYGTLWCPACDKPKVENVPTLNLAQAIRHLEAIGHTGISDRMWNKLVDEYGFANDTSFYLSFPKGDDRDCYDRQYLSDLDLIKDTWGLDDGVMMSVWW